mmetsp:Transcript_5574/g.12257  ORF Transcript_5574/g.12257 Transcript_5574/m.12257 type:complete len:259 (+) Transcript_5574:2620-3396(+)
MGTLTSTVVVYLDTVMLSPVRLPSSVLNVFVFRWITRASAGTLSPTRRYRISPGTISEAGRAPFHAPSRSTQAFSGCSFLSASRLSSALLLCQMPTKALSTRMDRMMKGSAKACRSFSKAASTPESAATARRICTSLSWNCSSTRLRRVRIGGAGSELGPYLLILVCASSVERPMTSDTCRLSRQASAAIQCAQLSASGGATMSTVEPPLSSSFFLLSLLLRPNCTGLLCTAAILQLTAKHATRSARTNCMAVCLACK